MKNICFISGDISRSGGTERVGLLLANELARRNYNVTILSIWRGESTYFYCNPQIKRETLLNNFIIQKLHRFKVLSIIKLHHFIKINKIDILIDIDAILILLSAYATIGTRCKIISWDHFNYYTIKKDPKRVKALKLVKRYSSQLVVLTKSDINNYIAYEGINHNKITQIYNPVPLTPIHKSDLKSKKVVSIGNYIPEKGFDLLLQVWRVVETQKSDWVLEIIGSGKEEITLKQLSKDLKLQKVIFSDKTKDIEAKYAKASIYALSSRSEGFPMVLLEACAMGLPIVAFDCQTGPNEIVNDSRNGFLIQPNNVDIYAKKLLQLMNDMDLRNRFGLESIKIANNFSINKITDQWEKIFNEIL